MKLFEILYDLTERCEIVYTDEDGNIVEANQYHSTDYEDDEFLGTEGRERWIATVKKNGWTVEGSGDVLNAYDKDDNEVGAHLRDDSNTKDEYWGYFDDHYTPLEEAAIRQFRRFGSVIKRQYRCTSGPKKGKIVASPQACGQRKDPRKIRHGKKVARLKKGVRIRKTTIAKKKSVSRMVVRMNRRLSGKK